MEYREFLYKRPFGGIFYEAIVKSVIMQVSSHSPLLMIVPPLLSVYKHKILFWNMFCYVQIIKLVENSHCYRFAVLLTHIPWIYRIEALIAKLKMYQVVGSIHTTGFLVNTYILNLFYKYRANLCTNTKY